MRVIRALLLIGLLVVVAFFAFGLWTGGSIQRADRRTDIPAGTSGTVDTATARSRGAELGERAAAATAAATAKIEETVEEARITAKIKAKMALDDYVKARAIDVTTTGSTVTLSGTVGSAAERERAVRIARETAGVSQVVDKLQIR